MRGEVGLHRSEPRLHHAGALRQESPEGSCRRRGAAETSPRGVTHTMIWEKQDPKLETPAGQGAGSRTYPAKQCAAVSTQDAATRTPPHRGCPLSCSLTSQGQAPGGAVLPPTMRP